MNLPELSVTVVVPVKNEEINLRKCLARLNDFKKIVVVDSNSTDLTPAIAREYGAEIVNFNWNGEFPKKRNWYLHNHKLDTDWVLFIDADEYVTPEFIQELRETLPNTKHVGFWLSYHNYFLNRYLKYGDLFTKLALFRVGAGEYERIDDKQWSKLDMEVHEHPILNGTTGKITHAIEHQDFKGIKSYIERHNEYSSWEAERYMSTITSQTFKLKKLTMRQNIKYWLLDSWLLGPLYFVYSYIFKLGFLDGKPGFVFCLNKMIYFLQIKTKIVELKLKL